MQVLTLNEIEQVSGAGCSVGGYAAEAATGAVYGGIWGFLRGGPAGAKIGAIAGAVSKVSEYHMTCSQ